MNSYTRALGPRRTWTVRTRLTALYGALFLISGTALLAITYGLVDHATSTETVTIVYPGGGSVSATVELSQPVESRDTEISFGHGDEGGEPLPNAATMRQIAQEQHNQRMMTLLSQSGIALAVMAAVGVLLGWVMAGRALHPLSTITEATKRISASNLHERLGLTGPNDEITRLGDTIDELLERLDHAFQAQRLFVANASHELRTPLARARTVAQVALDDPDATPESLRDAHERAITAGAQQEHLIDALLTLAQGQAGAIRRETLDLADLTGHTVETRQQESVRHGIVLRADLEEAAVVGDQRLLEHLVGNLIDNAIRHNRAEGTVHVTTRALPSPRLVVTNTGPVVPADTVDELTQPFRRLAPHRGPSGEGHGLGLAIVKAVTDAHAAILTITPLDAGGLRLDVTFPIPGRHDTEMDSDAG